MPLSQNRCFARHALDERAFALSEPLPTGDRHQFLAVQHLAATLLPADQPTFAELFQSLVGMNDRKTERVGNVLLGDGDEFAAVEDIELATRERVLDLIYKITKK